MRLIVLDVVVVVVLPLVDHGVDGGDGDGGGGDVLVCVHQILIDDGGVRVRVVVVVLVVVVLVVAFVLLSLCLNENTITNYCATDDVWHVWGVQQMLLLLSL